MKIGKTEKTQEKSAELIPVESQGTGLAVIENADVLVIEEPKATGISEQSEKLIEKSIAPRTYESYMNRLACFARWLNGRWITDQSLADYCSYLYHERGNAPSTIESVRLAVKWFLKNKLGVRQLDLPYTSKVIRGIRRDGRERGIGQRKPLTWEQVERICGVQEVDGTLQGLRNSAIIRVMSDGMLRASEVTELKVSDLEGKGLTIRFSKTDPEGQGSHVHLCVETRRILKKWLERAEITEGYVFRYITKRGDKVDSKYTGKMSYNALQAMIQRSAARVGITEKIGTHSLRIGTAVSLVSKGASLVEMQVAGRWKSPSMPAHYARAQLAENGAIARYKESEEDTDTDNEF